MDCIANNLGDLCADSIQYNVDLSKISQWKIGGVACVILQPASRNEIIELQRWVNKYKLARVIIGYTTNILFSDQGLKVPCIQIGDRFANVEIVGVDVSAQAGVWVPRLARKLMQAGLTGGEHICGIPGTLGGLVCMNGGSLRKSIDSNIVSIESVDAQGEIRVRLREECDFSYRNSIFRKNNEIITNVNMRFEIGDRINIRRTMIKILKERRNKFPRKLPNCGSVFKSSPSVYNTYGPPGAIIESLGFKGSRSGGALVSNDHANFIINNGDAAASDVLRLINKISSIAKINLGILLEPEVVYVTENGETLCPLNVSTE